MLNPARAVVRMEGKEEAARNPSTRRGHRGAVSEDRGRGRGAGRGGRASSTIVGGAAPKISSGQAKAPLQAQINYELSGAGSKLTLRVYVLFLLFLI